MPDLRNEELDELRETLAELVSDLERTFNGLDDDVRHYYREAEQSVIDARRKVESHEGLLQVN